jgi:hypothetical protein
VKVKLPPLPPLTEFRTMEGRASNWTPVQAQIKGIVIDEMRKIKTQTPNSTGNLDRSLHSLDVWRVDRLSVEFGSGLQYAASHDIYLRKKKSKPLITYSEKLDERLVTALRDWVVTGRVR